MRRMAGEVAAAAGRKAAAGPGRLAEPGGFAALRGICSSGCVVSRVPPPSVAAAAARRGLSTLVSTRDRSRVGGSRPGSVLTPPPPPSIVLAAWARGYASPRASTPKRPKGAQRFTREVGVTVKPGSAIEAGKGVMHLGNLRPAPFAVKDKTRVGRGRGSGRGKTSGRGHNGQKARSGRGNLRVGFEGGQTPLRKTLPKRGFKQAALPNRMRFQPVNLGTLQQFIEAGRLDPTVTLTMKDFVDSRMLDPRVGNGVKLLAKLDVALDPETGEPAIDEFGNTRFVPFTHKVNVEAGTRRKPARDASPRA